MTSERRHEGADADGSGVGEELGHLGHAPDVLVPVWRREAEVAAEAFADVVAVEAVAHDAWNASQSGKMAAYLSV